MSPRYIGARWGDCEHRIARDHMAVIDDGEGRSVWRCSVCRAEAAWGPGWRYYGNLECPRCGRAVIERVECPACAARSNSTAEVLG